MICDTSALLAAFASDQPHHQECAELLVSTENRSVSPLVLMEIDRIARRFLDETAGLRMLRELTGPSYQMLHVGPQTVSAATHVMASTGLDLVDATLVVHAKEMKTLDLFTLDQEHFRKVRALNGLPFRLLPFDLDV
jgi:uncharacterized protein